MTIKEAIDQAAILEPSQYPQSIQVLWLSDLDGQIYDELVRTHEDPIAEVRPVYAPDVDEETDLLVPEPYADLYRWYLVGRIQTANGDLDRYNNTLTLYTHAYDAFAAYYNRTHMPCAPHRFIY